MFSTPDNRRSSRDRIDGTSPTTTSPRKPKPELSSLDIPLSSLNPAVKMSQQQAFGSASPGNGPLIASQMDDDDYRFMGQGPQMPVPQHHPPTYLSGLMPHPSSLGPSSMTPSSQESLWQSQPPQINVPHTAGEDDVPIINIQRTASPAMPYQDLYSIEPHSPNPGLAPPGTPSEEGGHSPAFNPSMLWQLNVGDYRPLPSPDNGAGLSPTSVISDGQFYLSPTNTSPHSPFSPPSPFSPDHSMVTSPDDLLQLPPFGRMRSASDSHLNMEFAFPSQPVQPPHAQHRMNSDPTGTAGLVHQSMLLSPVSEDSTAGQTLISNLARRHSTTSRHYPRGHRYSSSEPIAVGAPGTSNQTDLLTPDYGLLRGDHSGRGRQVHRLGSGGAIRTPVSSRGTSPYSRSASPSGSEYSHSDARSSFGGYGSDAPPPSPSQITKVVVTTDPIAEASSKRRTHEARFECEICHKKLTTKTNLDGHRNSHFGVKEFQCQFCDKRFTRDWDRKRHEKTHSKKNSMQCDLCGKTSSRKDAFANHRCRGSDQDSNGNSNDDDKGEGPSTL